MTVLAWMGQLVQWYRGSTHRRVLSAAAIVAVFAFGAKLIGAAKEILVAHQFGTSDEVDAFGLALTLPAFAISLIGGSLNAAFIPTYVDEMRRGGRDAAQRLLSTVLMLSVGLLVAAALVLAWFVPTILPLVSRRFTPEKLRLTVELSYILIPCVVIAGTSMTWNAVLNARQRFAAPSAASLAVPLVGVLMLILFGKAWGVRALALGVLLGYCAEAVFVAWATRREGLHLLPRWGGLTPPVRRVIGQYAPMIAGGLVMGLNPVFDSGMASRLDAGSVASLGYGNKVVMFGMGIGSLSLSAAVFPFFSRLASEENWSGLAKTLRTYTLALLAVTVPVTIAIMALSEPICRLLYERGAFTHSDTLRVAQIQALYLIQVPFHLTGLLFVRFVSATGGNKILMWLSGVNAVVNVVGNIVLSRYLGAAGIALSTSVVFVLAFTLLGLYTWRRLAVLRSMQAERSEATEVARVAIGGRRA